VVRGLAQKGIELRPQVRLIAGRWFTPGKRETVVSGRMAERFANFNIGDRFTTGGKELTVTGWFNGGNSAFDSEVRIDAEDARSIFDRENYSSVLVRVTGPEAAKSLIARIESDKPLPLRALPETDYY